MPVYNNQLNPSEVPGYQPNRFEVPKAQEQETSEAKEVSVKEKGVGNRTDATALEEGQIRRVIEQAVEEVRPTSAAGEAQPLSQADLQHVIENVELKIGENLDGMSPHQLLETLINLPRNNN